MIEIKNKLTVLLNSCDKYEDVWKPFFVLFNKYAGVLKQCDIVINTETKNYSFPGLNIRTFSLFNGKSPLWGERLKRTLDMIKTDYVILFMEDYFLVEKIDDTVIIKVITWLDENEDCCAFNMIPLDGVAENDTRFLGFNEVIPGTPYRCNPQVCIWRKDILDKSILDNESPWIWEDIGTKRNDILMTSKVYALSWKVKPPINYNFYEYNRMNEIDRTYCHSGLIKGKWHMGVVRELFKNNGIDVDFNVRGIYHQPIKDWIKCNKILRLLVLAPYRLIIGRLKRKIMKERKSPRDNTYNNYIAQYVTPYLNREKF